MLTGHVLGSHENWRGEKRGSQSLLRGHFLLWPRRISSGFCWCFSDKDTHECCSPLPAVPLHPLSHSVPLSCLRTCTNLGVSTAHLLWLLHYLSQMRRRSGPNSFSSLCQPAQVAHACKKSRRRVQTSTQTIPVRTPGLFSDGQIRV